MVEPSELLPIFFMVSAVTVLALAGLYAAAAVRRWSQRERSTETFSLEDLRGMRARGEISESEFKAMRATLLGQMAATLGDIPAAPPRRAGRESGEIDERISGDELGYDADDDPGPEPDVRPPV